MKNNILSLNNTFFEGGEISAFTGIIEDFENRGIYAAHYNDVEEKFSDISNRYKVYWDIREFLNNLDSFDWGAPHSFAFFGNDEDAERMVKNHIQQLPAYEKKIEIGSDEVTILHRPKELYPGMHHVIFWAFAKDSLGKYYKVFWNVFNIFEPFKIEMTTDYSRYCKKCLQVWSNIDRRCIDNTEHEYVRRKG